MRIERIERESTAGRTRVSARLVWEDRERAAESLWYEWPSEFDAEVVASPAAVLVAALPLALVNGERRIAMDAPVCAYLLDHLRNVVQLFCVWFPNLRPISIDVARDSNVAPSGASRAALCLSGGVDSLAALVDNHAALAPEHGQRFRVGIYLFGLNTYDFAEGAPVPARLAWYEEYGRRLEALCQWSDLQLVRVATNVRSLYADWPSWQRVGQSSALAAVGHAMPSRMQSLTIAAPGVGAYISASGSEPALDPLFSSYALDVRSVHATQSRVEKVAIIARHPEALAVLRVCFTHDVPAGPAINCGRCEKCVRTMLALIAAGALDRTTTFPSTDVSPATIAAIEIDLRSRAQHYQPMIEPLASRGRRDLADAIAARIATFEAIDKPKSLVRRLFSS